VGKGEPRGGLGPDEEEQWGKKRREKKKEKREKKIKKRKRKKWKNQGREIEKGFRKLGEFLEKLGERFFLWIFRFFGRQRDFWDGGDSEADWPAGPRRARDSGTMADRGAGVARVGAGLSAGGAGGIRGTRAEGERGRDGDQGFERGK
jgi:hypothetical protein